MDSTTCHPLHPNHHTSGYKCHTNNILSRESSTRSGMMMGWWDPEWSQLIGQVPVGLNFRKQGRRANSDSRRALIKDCVIRANFSEMKQRCCLKKEVTTKYCTHFNQRTSEAEFVSIFSLNPCLRDYVTKHLPWANSCE